MTNDDESFEEDGTVLPFGRCDTCGAPCDENGCTVDRQHVIARDEDDTAPAAGQ